MLKLKVQYWCKELTHLKRPWCWERLMVGGEGMIEDEMARWHQWLDGRESEWTLGVGDGHGGLECCGPWGCKESGMTERLALTYLHSVQFSRSVVSNSLQPHGLQHARPPCPSPTPGVYSNSCPLSQWCHPTILSSVIPFSHFQSFPALGSFQMSHFFSHQVAKVLEIQLQHQSCQWIFKTDFL